ncbi:MAG: hypothetical protein EOO85_30055 [Pedobacter sp.]|nr:MAG: hypothetical protein EOO85_30055 [Pedobacter sp.]
MPTLFPTYRTFDKFREETNNNVIALLVSSRIGAFHIYQVHNKSDSRLPGIFPNIKDISRFNLYPTESLTYIQSSEHTLISMAITQILSVYEVFIKDAAKILLENGYHDSKVNLRNLERKSIVHVLEFVRKSCGIRKNDVNWRLYDYIRNIRNNVTHALGKVDSDIDYDMLSPKLKTEWEKRAGRPFSEAMSGNYISFQVGELVAILSLAQVTALNINNRISAKVSKRYWARLAVRDFQTRHPKSSIHNVPLKKIETYVSMYYGSIEISKQTLKNAINNTA